MSENINTKIHEQNQKQIHKMKKYIRTFPLKSEEIILIHKDIEGMEEEAKVRGERLENVLGKSPREFCDELMYAVGGIKTPGGRKILRFVSGWYKFLAFLSIFGALMNFLSIFVSMFEGLLGNNLNMLEELKYFVPVILKCAVEGIIYYIAGKRALQYSTDVSQSDKAMKWGVGMLIFELLYWMVILIADIGNIDIGSMLVVVELFFSLVINCFASVLFIIGARRNRPHPEGELE